MRSVLERLAGGDILVGDGAMGSMLFERGLRPGDCPEALNLSQPEILADIARLFLDAGADIIQTNTFGGSPIKLSDYGLGEKAGEINEKAVEIVKRAVDGQAYVSGSCGPSGKILQPYGDAQPDDLYRSFEQQINALLAAGVDLICVETMTDLREATLAVQAAKAAAPPHVPVMATMTFDPTPGGFFTIMGVSIPAAAEGLAEAGADVIGSNCGNGIENMIRIAREFSEATELPLIIQSNAGLPEARGGSVVYGETAAFFADKTGALLDAGVSVVGGCCGTTPEHIRAIRNVVAARAK